jgi:uncharacterized protein YigA (DUF484 family)
MFERFFILVSLKKIIFIKLFSVQDLPNEVAEAISLVSEQFQKVRESIQSLEDRLSKALNLQERIKVLQSMTNFLPKEEIELTIEKSSAKIEAAKMLQNLIDRLWESEGYLTNENMQAIDVSLQSLNSDLNLT